MTNRATMLETVRRALQTAALPGAEPHHPGRFGPPPFSDDLETRFRAELTSLGGAVHEAADARSAADVVIQLLPADGPRTVLSWEPRWLPLPGIVDALVDAGVSILHQSPEHARSQPHRVQLAAAALGLTGADAGLAETGSIVVASGPGRGRLASLLPPVHVALLRRQDILPSLPVLMATRQDLVMSGANFACITGPSRTADIEHVLARGVHGPGHVHVILV